MFTATARIYFNDEAAPDPYPCPGGMFPFTAADEETYVPDSGKNPKGDLAGAGRGGDCHQTV